MQANKVTPPYEVIIRITLDLPNRAAGAQSKSFLATPSPGGVASPGQMAAGWTTKAGTLPPTIAASHQRDQWGPVEHEPSGEGTRLKWEIKTP